MEFLRSLYRKFYILSIRTKILLVFLLIMAVFLFRLTFSTRYYLVERQGQERVAEGLNVAHHYFQHYIDRFDVNFRVLADAIRQDGLTEQTFRRMLEDAGKLDQAYRADIIFYINANNEYLCNDSDSFKKTGHPAYAGQFFRGLQAVRTAFQGKEVKGVEVLPAELVQKEGLAEQTKIPVVPTASAEPKNYQTEMRALSVISARPVTVQGKVAGVIGAVRILNNRFDIVDMITGDIGCKATIFLDDIRISTNVTNEDGSRAVGTILSDQVRATVLEKGSKFFGRAFVVNKWYITAYEPIRDLNGKVVGSLYVGIEEAPLVKAQGKMNWEISLTVFGLTLVFVLALYWLYRSIVLPVHRMSAWALRCARGELECRLPSRIPNKCWELMNCGNIDCPVYGKTNVRCWLVPRTPCTGFSEDVHKNACRSCKVYKLTAGNEIDQLADAFNFMAASIQEYTDSLYDLNLQLEEKNNELTDQKDELECQKEQLMALNRELEESMKALDDSQSIIYALAVAVEAKDPYTRGHSERVADYSTQLAAAIGLAAHQCDIIRGAALLHDIGKIGISGTILRKPVSLTAVEFQQVKKHPIIGERICSSLKFAREMLPIIRHHHEHFNGQGYPDGLRGDKIPLMARIVAVADAFDAMTSDRPYRPGMTTEQALEILEKGAGTQWDPQLVPIFATIIRKGVGEFPDRGRVEKDEPLV